jgi:hypothetical protein
MNQHPEIITAPFTIWIAPAGTAFPALSAAPADPWRLLGTNGARGYGESGVVLASSQQWVSPPPPAGETAPTASALESEELRVQLELIDLTLEQFALTMGGAAVTTVAPGPGTPGFRRMGLAIGPGTAGEFALLVRGPSPYNEDMPAQFELPRACQIGSPRPVFSGGSATRLAVEFKLLPDPAATSEAERFGRLMAQDSGPGAPAFSPGPSIGTDGTPQVGDVVTLNPGTATGGTIAGADIELLSGAAVIATNPGATYMIAAGDLGESLSLRVTARGDGGATTVTSAAVGPVTGPSPISAFEASGAVAVVPSTSGLSQVPFSVANDGFDEDGAAATYNDINYLTVPRRQVWPNPTLDESTKMALAELIYTTSVIAGATNGSLVEAPPPIGRHVTPDRLVVGDTVYHEIAAGCASARNGRQVACIRARMTDGTNFSDWVVVNTTQISSYCEDVYPVEVFPFTHDVSGLADGGVMLTLEAELVPWLGDASTIISTADEAALTQFSPRYFWRDTARAAAPPIAYVGTATGNDGTGTWSTTEATAAAAPFATSTAAIAAIVTQSAATGGYADGCILKAMTGGFVFGSGAGTLRCPHYLGAITVTAAPGVARADAIVSWGTAALRPNTGVSAALANTTVGPGEVALLFDNVKLTRTGSQAMSGTSAGGITPPLFVQRRNCIVDNANQTAGMLAATAHDAAFGEVVTNLGTSVSTAYSGSQQRRMWRGLDIDLADIHGLRFASIIGSRIARFRSNSHSDISKGVFLQSFMFTRQRYPLALTIASGSTISNCAFIQGGFEFIGALTGGQIQPALAICASTGNSDNVFFHHVIGTGFGEEGKWNIFYSGFGAPGLPQTHTRVSMKGCIPPQPNLKGDWFNSDATDIGNLDIHHGTGFNGNWFQFHPNVTTNESEGWEYPGRNTSYPTGAGSNEVRNDPLFTNYQGTTGTGGVAVAGVGDGTYTLQAGSPARDFFSEYLLGFDFAGNPRPTSGTVDLGLYA